jgi:hypothetical protein
MADKTPFSAPQAGRTISGRQRQIDRAVDRASGAGQVRERSNRTTRHRPRSANAGGAPSGSTSMRTSDSERARVEAEQRALMQRLNAQSSDSNN